MFIGTHRNVEEVTTEKGHDKIVLFVVICADVLDLKRWPSYIVKLRKPVKDWPAWIRQAPLLFEGSFMSPKAQVESTKMLN